MDKEPTTLADAVDEAMTSLLGADGFDSYAVMCEQTMQARKWIEEETRAGFLVHLEGVLAERPDTDRRLAAMEAQRRVQEELAVRLAAEERRFRAAVAALFAYMDDRRPNDPGCAD